MKLRDLPRAFGLGFAPREYPSTIATFMLPVDGEVRRGTVFALEPNPYVFKVLTANAVRGRELTRPDMALWRHVDVFAVPAELA